MNNEIYSTKLEIERLYDQIDNVLYKDGNETVLVAKNLIHCLITAREVMITLDERLKKLELL